MLRSLGLIWCILNFTLPAFSQSIRPSQALQESALPIPQPYKQPTMATAGELSVVAWVFNSNLGDEVYVSTSDGRGFDWSAAARLDNDATGAEKNLSFDSVAILDNYIFVSWLDQRHATSFAQNEAFLNWSDDGGQTWQGERLVPKGFSFGDGSAVAVRMVAVPAQPAPKLHFLFASFIGFNLRGTELFLTTSVDAGQSFAFPNRISVGPDIQWTTLSAEGDELQIAWNSQAEILHQKSFDGGLTWLADDMSIAHTLSGPSYVASRNNPALQFQEQGDFAVLAWKDEADSGLGQALLASVSNDNGNTWTQPIQIGTYDSQTNEVGTFHLAISDQYAGLVWTDNRTTDFDLYAAFSYDSGISWNENRLAGEVLNPQLLHASYSSTDFTAIWHETYLPVREARTLYSADQGRSWAPSFVATDNPASAFMNETGRPVFNSDYQNILSSWTLADQGVKSVRVGGFRVPYFRIHGPLAAGNLVNFELFSFYLENKPFGGVVMSGGTGDLYLPGDGRNLGLITDPILIASRQEIPGLLSTTLNGVGSGATPQFIWPNSVPSGTRLYITAFSYDNVGGLTFGDLADIKVSIVQ